MDTIKNYLETLFLELPKTEAVEKAKADLLANMEDHYFSLIDEGKSEHEAIGAVISEFGSVDELRQTLEIEEEPEADFFEDEDELTLPIDEEEMLTFLAGRKQIALGLSLGIMFTILAVAAMILFSEVGEALGMSIFFIFVSIGVGLIIYYGMQFQKIDGPLHDRMISRNLVKKAQALKGEYTKSFTIGLILGICSCILSVVPIFVFSYAENFGAALLMAMISIGVFLICYSSIYYTGFDKFVESRFFVGDEDKLGPNARKEKYGNNAEKKYVIEKMYWPVIVVTYFIWSFVFDAWHISWVLLVAGGILWSGIEAVIKKV
ncbi:permease prefix domain 1-containing protein [Enterococcus alishanensis]